MQVPSPSPSHARRLELAHAVARLGVRLPRPLFWFASNVVCRALLPPLGAPLRCPTIYGFDLVVRATDGANYYRCGFYEQGTMHVIAACLREGDVYVDAGASVGQMAFHAARAVGATGRVLAFEPAPDRFEDLVAGIALNDLSRVLALPVGLADAAGERALFLRGSPSMVEAACPSVRVAVRRLDDVLAEHAVDRVRFLKIDVEGLEPEVLAGAPRLLACAAPPIICYEHGIYRHACAVPWLLPGHYRYFQLAGTAHRPSRLVETAPHRLRADNVFAIPAHELARLPHELFARRALHASSDANQRRWRQPNPIAHAPTPSE